MSFADTSAIFEWRGSFGNLEVNALHAEAFETRLFDAARAGARRARCEFLHVDFDDRLRRFYIDECGFTSVGGGLMQLS